MAGEVEYATKPQRRQQQLKDARSVEKEIVTILRPAFGWQLVNVREMWQFRGLMGQLAWRDVKVR